MSGGGSGGGGQTTTQIQQIDPIMRPYIDYGLQEATRLYQNPDIPQYYPGQTYIAPSQQTQAAFNACCCAAGTKGLPVVARCCAAANAA